jgi:preprotein translocase subunit SecG
VNLDELMQNVKPTLGPFADTLGPKLIMIVGLVWILCLVGAVLLLMKGGLEFAASRSGGRPMATSDGVMDIGVPVLALIFLAIIPAVVQALI